MVAVLLLAIDGFSLVAVVTLTLFFFSGRVGVGGDCLDTRCPSRRPLRARFFSKFVVAPAIGRGGVKTGMTLFVGVWGSSSVATLAFFVFFTGVGVAGV